MNDPWFGSEGKLDGSFALIRGREMVPEAVSPSTHSKLLRIVCEYDGDPLNRMPSATEGEEIGEFEERIVPALEEDHLCVLFAVLTYADHRYWLFYCRDKDATQRAIAGALGTEGDLPIDLQMEDDPQWDVLAKVLAQTHQQN